MVAAVEVVVVVVVVVTNVLFHFRFLLCGSKGHVGERVDRATGG